MDPVSVGLDIGSTAIRAAELGMDKGRLVLRRYGQIGLPKGYVADGSIINVPGVSSYLRRLWDEVGFSTNKVVLGVSGPQVFVRQAEMPALSREDLRSSLKFDSQELIPIPVDDASIDFSILDPAPTTGDDGNQTVRILLVAAHLELLRTYIAALGGAGLVASVIDASPLALMRVAPPGTATGLETIVSVGAELTTVAVRDAGVPRFLRSLTIGGAKVTESLASSLHLELAVAERVKRGGVAADSPIVPQAHKAVAREMKELAEDVRATVDFFLLQAGHSTIDRLLITGGAMQTEGLALALAGSQTSEVARIDPFAMLQMGNVGLTERQLEQASYTAATAVGLAMWTFDRPDGRVSILPDEVHESRRLRQRAILAGAGVAGLAVVLAGASVYETMAEHRAQRDLAATQVQVSVLQRQINVLQARTRIVGQVAARKQMASAALKGDVDWVRVLRQLAGVMPPGVSLSSFTASTSSPTGTSATQSAVPTAGSVTFTVTGTGGLAAASQWLQSLQSDPDFTGSWVSSIATTGPGGNSLSLNSDTGLTLPAQSNRSQEYQR